MCITLQTMRMLTGPQASNRIWDMLLLHSGATRCRNPPKGTGPTVSHTLRFLTKQVRAREGKSRPIFRNRQTQEKAPVKLHQW